jgi:hypothetical protein
VAGLLGLLQVGEVSRGEAEASGVQARQASSSRTAWVNPLEIVWEASLTIYLIVKGFRPSPILPDDPRSVPQMS